MLYDSMNSGLVFQNIFDIEAIQYRQYSCYPHLDTTLQNKYTMSSILFGLLLKLDLKKEKKLKKIEYPFELISSDTNHWCIMTFNNLRFGQYFVQGSLWILILNSCIQSKSSDGWHFWNVKRQIKTIQKSNAWFFKEKFKTIDMGLYIHYFSC